MIIAGAGGHGKELLALIRMQGVNQKNVFFFDENQTLSGLVDQIPVLQTIEELERALKKSPAFSLGVGAPEFREKLDSLLTELGGKITSVIAPTSVVQSELNDSDVFSFGFVGPQVGLGRGVLINTRASVHHDCQIGEYSEIGPGAILLGNVKIGRKCRIGAGAIILPGIILGDEVVVGAGAVVTRPIPSHQIVMGIPAKVKITNL